MFLDGKAVLRIVDTATCFLAATLSNAHGANYGPSAHGGWLVFIIIRCTLYTSYPNWLRSDQSSIFITDRWKRRIDQNGAICWFLRVSIHYSFKSRKCDYKPQREFYYIVLVRHHSTHLPYIIQVPFETINDTLEKWPCTTVSCTRNYFKIYNFMYWSS